MSIKRSYSKVVISASTALSFPAQRERENGGDFWVTGTQHHCSMETGWRKGQIKADRLATKLIEPIHP